MNSDDITVALLLTGCAILAALACYGLWLWAGWMAAAAFVGVACIVFALAEG